MGTITLSSKLYAKSAIFNAINKFKHILNIDISEHDNDGFILNFSESDDNLIRDFKNELIDQQLRFELDQSNKEIKELIVRHAFSPIENLKKELGGI